MTKKSAFSYADTQNVESRVPPFSLVLGQQVILVSARGSAAELRCFVKSRSGGWRFDSGLGLIPAFVGRNGVAENKSEGDGMTPAGLYRLGQAFGVREKPATKMPYRRVVPDSRWVDDPRSSCYNKWVETPAGDWNSAERLIDYPREYAYAVVIEYNTENTVPGKGSAVFLHCGEKPTAGCVAVTEPDLLRLLRWLDPELSPEILIAKDSSDT